MDIALAKQLASFVGALLILVAYGGHQMGWMNSRSTLYNILNAVGSGILGYIALHPFQIGFVVLESVWTLISLRVGPAKKGCRLLSSHGRPAGLNFSTTHLESATQKVSRYLALSTPR